MLLPTTVVGSHAWPGWYTQAQEAVAQGLYGPKDLKELRRDAVTIAVEDQQRAGIDIITDGEMACLDFHWVPAVEPAGRSAGPTHGPKDLYYERHVESLMQAQVPQAGTREQSEADLWDAEYSTLHVIPSSTRTGPAKALVLFTELVGLQAGRTVLDAGCGNGRNAVYLAQKGCTVYAVDFSRQALSRARSALEQAKPPGRVHFCRCSLVRGLPFKDCSFDFVLDSYVFCHFTDDCLLEYYPSELGRVTRPGGIVLSFSFSRYDEYYQSVQVSQRKDSNAIVVDPRNGIKKRLYFPCEIKDVFGKRFKTVYFADFQFDDTVLGKHYMRDILVLALEKQ